jgi:S-adenosylmethionine:tRNA ribosyltransferase-isomerase
VPDGAALRRVAAYRYELPPELIARTPAEPADASRLLVVDDGALRELPFTGFPSLLRGGDVLAINETRVIRARLHGTREPGGGAAEILLLRPSGGGAFDPAAPLWDALVRPGRRLRAGARVRFGDEGFAEIVEVREGGVRGVRFDVGTPFEELLERHGELPLPPYVGPGDAVRAERYQTMFARVAGSVAAPTASLHFTPRVVAELVRRGVEIVPLVLDVGLGTFRPMEGETIDEHRMHAERYAIPDETAHRVNAAKAEGRRVIAAGTTVLRALEASALAHGGRVAPGEAETELFVSPGFRFAIVDALLTNFHLPGSTLLVLVAAFAGYKRAMVAYAHAIEERFRFYSFGDAMFVTPPVGNVTAALGESFARRE